MYMCVHSVANSYPLMIYNVCIQLRLIQVLINHKLYVIKM